MSARNSIRPTYDSRETGPRYHITTCVGSQFIDLEKRMPDPFVHQTVIIGWRDLLRGLRHRSLTVTVTVSADPNSITTISAPARTRAALSTRISRKR